MIKWLFKSRRSLLLILLCSVAITSWLSLPTLVLALETTPTGEPGYWYEVQRGDSWSTVSRDTGVSVQDLWGVNPDKLNWRRWLYAGDRIWIPAPVACPADISDYPAEILTFLNSEGTTPAGLEFWLTSCGVLADFHTLALAGTTESDIALVINDLSTGWVIPPSQLLIYHATEPGYWLAHQASSDGQIEIVDISDINMDGRREVTWTETFCGAHTCYSTLYVERWHGELYEDWIVGMPTMASAEIGINTAGIAFPYNEIVMTGDIIGSVGAGPQRVREELYLFSPDTPYYLASTIYQTSDCIYHHILDANERFDTAEGSDFAFAITGYEETLIDTTLTACAWRVTDQLDTLRNFARFRLLVAHAAQGTYADGQLIAADITNSDIAGAADAFQTAFSAMPDLDAACAAVTTFAEVNPGAWDYLADWGYAHPSFSAEKLCAGSGSISGMVWLDACSVSDGGTLPPDPRCIGVGGVLQANGIFETGESNIHDVSVKLHNTTCAMSASSSTFNTDSTGIGGDYRFDHLNAGDYCVEIDMADEDNIAVLVPGGWTYPSAGGTGGTIQVDVSLTPGETVDDVHFGWDYQFD